MKRLTALLIQLMEGRYGQYGQNYRSVLVVGIQLLLVVAANLTAFALRFPTVYDGLL